MIRIGVTGGIGSGKTQFCVFLAELGATIAYADRIAQQLMTSDPDLMVGIRRAFGEQAYHSDGSLNRPWLSEQAFTLGKVETLNQLVHPRVAQVINERAAAAEREGVALFVREAALLLDRGRPPDLDYVIWIDAPENIRLERVLRRDNLSETEIRSRMARQRSLPEVLDMVDEVIENHQDPIHLQHKALQLYNRWTHS